MAVRENSVGTLERDIMERVSFHKNPPIHSCYAVLWRGGYSHKNKRAIRKWIVLKFILIYFISVILSILQLFQYCMLFKKYMMHHDMQSVP